MITPVVIYDGDCAFCSSAARFGKRRIAKQLQFLPYQLTDLNPYGLTVAQCEAALQFVASSGKIFTAQNAIAQLLIAGGGIWKFTGLLIKLPVINQIAAVGYKFTAANRHRLPGGTPTCKLN